MGKNLIVEMRERKSAATYQAGQLSTETFHREGPVHPNGAKEKDTIDNMKERVDGNGAGRESFSRELIVDPRTGIRNRGRLG